MIEPSPLLVWGSETICQRLLKPQLCHNFFFVKSLSLLLFSICDLFYFFSYDCFYVCLFECCDSISMKVVLG